MIRYRIQALAAGLAILLAVSAAFAQGGKGAGNKAAGKGAGKAAAQQAARADIRTVGSVVSVSGDKVTVSAPRTGNIVLKVEPTTEITGFKEIQKTDLATGQWVSVTGQATADSAGVDATEVVVLAEKPTVAPRAQGTGSEVGQLTVTGDQLSLKTEDKVLKIAVSDKTLYKSRPKIAVTDLKVGDIVAALGRDVAGENVATVVAVEPNAQTAKADSAQQKAADKPNAANRAPANKGGGGKAAGGGKANKAGGGMNNRANGANVGV